MSKFKKLAAIVLSALMMISAVPAVSYAANATSGMCNFNVEWTLDENGTLVFSGTGELNSGSWNKEDVKTVIIEQGITSIGYNAFYDCRSLVEVTIPDSVTNIGPRAFENCKSLTEIIIPDSVTSIGFCAFSDCSSLTEIIIPTGVTSIGSNAFDGCDSVENVYYNGSFDMWGNILIEYGNNILTYNGINIDGEIYYLCGPKATWTYDDHGVLTISGEGDINSSPWGDIEIKEIIIEDGITGIGRYTFAHCNSLISVTIPNSVTQIGDSAFLECTSLKSITIPEKVIHIGELAFYGCDSIENVYYNGSFDMWGDILIELGNNILTANGTIIDGKIYYLCGSRITWDLDDFGVLTICGEGDMNNAPWDKTAVKKVIIDDRITGIVYHAFADCTSLVSVDIPANVVSIGNGAFANCTSMLQINVDERNANFTSVNGVLFDKEKTTLISFPGGKQGEYTIPDGVETIESGAFENCSYLTEIHLPSSIKSINALSFSDCDQMKDVYYSGTKDEFDNIFISAKSGLSGRTLHIDGKTNTIPFYCGDNVTWILNDNGTLTISGTGEMYYYSSFGVNMTPWYEMEVKTVIIEDGVTSIGAFAFYNCASLTSVDIPESITCIDNAAFSGCTSIASITIPKCVTYIGWDAFSWCTSLTSIDIPDSVIGIHDSAFSGCTSLVSVTIPQSVLAIGYESFRYCISLSSITIPNSVTYIGYGAFQNCSSLAKIAIPNSVTDIGYSAFQNCGALTDVYYTGSEEEWNNIIINSENEDLTGATIHFNSEMPPQDIIGDIDGDGNVTMKDSNLVKRIITGLYVPDVNAFTADLNSDGVVNTKDSFIIKKMILAGK